MTFDDTDPSFATRKLRFRQSLPNVAAITRVLAAPIVDDDELQQEILSIMSSTDEQFREMRRTGLEAIVVEAVF